ncbi:MAG: hypothetical protein NTW86_20170 [Candidatus Sumerlaeota bacterium]|nr:hypothetical protein [Candidatus Sumerlaeota bacterium]
MGKNLYPAVGFFAVLGLGLWLSPPADGAQVTIPGVVLRLQIKDTAAPAPGLNCVQAVAGPGNYCIANPGVHSAANVPRDDVAGNDGVYGNNNDCLHCSYYCAPASILMLATFEGVLGLSQDKIYDNAKSIGGGVVEVVGDGIIQTHGVGLWDGGAANAVPLEVDAGLTFAGLLFIRFDSGAPEAPMAAPILQAAIGANHPVGWCDHPSAFPPPAGQQGWPMDMFNPPIGTTQQAEGVGHMKVIAGYDDNGTPGNLADDRYYVYDPWPNAAATRLANPYWETTAAVLPSAGPSQDAKDVFYEITGRTGAGVGDWRRFSGAATNEGRPRGPR